MFLRVIGLILVVFFVGILPVNGAEDESIKDLPIGGSCAYKQYEGITEIISIKERSYPKIDSYEIKFMFYPDAEIEEQFAKTEGREFLLLTKRGSYPRATFIMENNIEVGKVLDCTLNVIIKGSCTPIIFEFPSIKN